MNQSKKNILITGGAGFIPSSLADRLLQNPNYFVVLIDNFLTGKKENIPQHENCKFIHGDVNNFEEIAPLFSLYNFDYVFHYAAVVGVKRTLENPIMVLDDIYGIRNILDLSKRTGVTRVFYASSSEVYGEPVHLPQHETITPLNSRLPYAVVKNVGESYFRSYQQEYGLDYTIFRFFNTYGQKQSTDFVMSRFIQLALSNQDITVYGDGSQTRTFCYIEDHLDACIKTMEADLMINDVANIGNGTIVTVLELAETIIRLTNSKSKIVHLPSLEEGDMTRRQPDITKMKELLGKPFTALEDGIQIILNNLIK
ncbi:NAD-dependent epimerase/dehydratase family protein [Fluviicola taffensis]|uniref:UDP-glucuronate decarboxylase n=1 Tax=Fluviicola taffensis (strain DSM 16823 / NCIMB 13979 / RW262) TaxID=755732 RepID=F2II35_FLUTR|nr:NAD-dependent epimerase/dehydratase family protein [Fluviicola taffensis]AEA42735.1 UDP-glucuronate decarboxylase [Fluviicola taffensis DSM 16823]